TYTTLFRSEWRQHIAAGGTCGVFAGSDYRAAGFDAGRSGCGDAQAGNPGQPECGLAVLRSTRHQLQKKLCTLQSKSARRSLASADVGCEGKVCLTRHNWCSSTKAGRIPAWCGCAAAVGAASD